MSETESNRELIKVPEDMKKSFFAALADYKRRNLSLPEKVDEMILAELNTFNPILAQKIAGRPHDANLLAIANECLREWKKLIAKL